MHINKSGPLEGTTHLEIRLPKMQSTSWLKTVSVFCFLALSAAEFAFADPQQQKQQQATLVQLKSGKVSGKVVEVEVEGSKKKVHFFEGIKYGKWQMIVCRTLSSLF